MIINELQVDGFGVFTAFQLRGLQNGVNVICGDNEAGKSTLLKFLRFTLFGYPSRTKERMAPLNGGNHGGRIVSTLADGRRVTFSRTAAGSGGEVEAHLDGRSTRDKAEWSQLLGGANEKLFNNIYAISLDELRDISALSESGVDDKIFSVGLGIGSASLKKIQEDLQARADAIWTARGSTKEIHQIVNRLRDQKQRLAGVQNDLATYATAKRSLAEFQTEIDQVDEMIRATDQQISLFNAYRKCYSDYEAIIEIDRAIAELPAVKELPADGPERLRGLRQEEKIKHRQIEDITRGDGAETGIASIEARVAALSTDAFILKNSSEIEYLGRNLEKYRQTVAESISAASRVGALRAGVDLSVRKIGGRWTREVISDYDDFNGASIRVATYRASLNEAKLRVVRAESEQQAIAAMSRPSSRTSGVVVSGVFILVSLYLFYIGLLAFGVALLILAVLLPFSLRMLSSKTSKDVPVSDIEPARDAERKLREEYLDYTRNELYFDGEIEPDLVVQKLTEISGSEARSSRDRRDRGRQASLRTPFIDEFEAAAASLLRGLNSQGAIIPEVERLIREYADAKEHSSERQSLEALLADHRSRLELAQTELAAITDNVTRLLASAGASSEIEFTGLYRAIEDEARLLTRKKQHFAALEAIGGGTAEAEDIIEYLQQTAKSAIGEKLSSLTEIRQSYAQRHDARYVEIGRLEAQIAAVEGEVEHAAILTDIETEKAKLASAYKRWIANELALEVLQRVKKRYEQEKQPEVLRNSTAYFTAITQGKYTRINANLDDREIEVAQGYSNPKKILELSRGTREQLLLSMRLGFIEEYEKEAEPLPLIVDDVLVHFDGSRAKAGAEAFHRFAENRQVLMFSCHLGTTELFGELPINVVRLERSY